jgi:hypothetical protein
LHDWREWVTESPRARSISRGAGATAAIGLTFVVAVALATLVRGRPFGSAGALIVPGVLVVLAGQAWAIAILLARRPVEQRPRRPWNLRRNRAVAERDPRRFFFDGLPIRQANALVAVAFLGWLAAMTSFPSLTSGGPTSPAPGCPYRLQNHGSYKCVSRATYMHAGAAEQRFAAGIIAAFLAIHLGVNAAELARRRVAATTPT